MLSNDYSDLSFKPLISLHHLDHHHHHHDLVHARPLLPYFPQVLTYLQGMLLSTLRMSEMQQMQSVGLTTCHLVMKGAGCPWNGQKVNVVRHHDGPKSGGNQKPTKTLFVINFDPIRTRVRDIEKHFEPHGKVLHVRIRRNFAFVQFENQEEATRALECTHMSKVLDRVVSVEYALKDDDERGDKYNSPRRDYGRQRDSPYQRSPSPVYRRYRPSPDYGRPRSPVHNGPSYDRYRSPQYGRYRSRSPVRRS